MPIRDRLDKESVAHIHHEIQCSIKKSKIMSFAGTWIELEAIILSKLTQEQKSRHHMFSHKLELRDENTWTQRGKTLRLIAG